jgi:hypothetical protein
MEPQAEARRNQELQEGKRPGRDEETGQHTQSESRRLSGEKLPDDAAQPSAGGPCRTAISRPRVAPRARSSRLCWRTRSRGPPRSQRTGAAADARESPTSCSRGGKRVGAETLRSLGEIAGEAGGDGREIGILCDAVTPGVRAMTRQVVGSVVLELLCGESRRHPEADVAFHETWKFLGMIPMTRVLSAVQQDVLPHDDSGSRPKSPLPEPVAQHGHVVRAGLVLLGWKTRPSCGSTPSSGKNPR